MRIQNRHLFLKYALPCAGTLVSRGTVSKNYVSHLVELVSQGKLPKENAEEMFKVANAMCKAIAMRMGKKAIDSKVIRTYFLLEHSKVVDDRYKLMGDFNPVNCKTYAGKVLKANGGFATVKMPLGTKRYRTDFVKGLRKNDTVSLHFNFIIEKISESMAQKMQGAGNARS